MTTGTELSVIRVKHVLTELRCDEIIWQQERGRELLREGEKEPRENFFREGEKEPRENFFRERKNRERGRLFERRKKNCLRHDFYSCDVLVLHRMMMMHQFVFNKKGEASVSEIELY